MADQDLRIKVAAETGAAQDALGRLADEMAGLAKASEGAGKEQQSLAKQTAATTQQVQAAREAVERAKRAQSEAAAITQAFGKDSREAAEAMTRLKAAEEAATKATRAAETALQGTADAVAEAAKAADTKAQPAMVRMANALKQAGREAEKSASDLRMLEARMESASKGAIGLSASFASFKGNLAANVVSRLGEGLLATGGHAIETAANFERLKTALATTTGSTEEANKKFSDLQAFAAATPFSVNEVTEAFIKLSNRGVGANNALLTSLGNTASAMGKTLDDAVEAAADAITGENERLKEFGIVGKLAGDKVEYTFRGVTKSVERNKDAIIAYLKEIGDTKFAGGMEAQSKTLGGLWSTLKDGFDQFLVSVMDSGISDALKSLMGTLSGMSNTGRVLSDVLGFTLGGAFQTVAVAGKVLGVVLDGVFWGLDKLLVPLRLVKDLAGDVASAFADETTRAMAEFAEQQRIIDAQIAERRQAEDAAYWESAKGSGTMATDMLRLIDLSGQYALALTEEGLRQLEVADAVNRRKKAEDELWAKLEQRNAKGEEKAIEDAFFKANEMGPALPPGFKRPEKAKKKKKDTFTGKKHDFDADVADFAFKTTQDVRKANAEAEVAAFEAESAIREKRITGLDREIEAIEARGIAESTHIDMIFATVEVEAEAERAREAAIDQRLNKEAELARWQARNAKTDEQREKAQTRLEAAEHAKRLNALRKVADAEEKEHRRRQQVTERVAGAISTLGDGMVSAFEAMAEGEKGAIAHMLSELLKGVAKKHAILALAEFALAAGSAASYNFPAAAAHAAAGGMHTGVAVAAGVGAVAAGKVWEAQREPATGAGGATTSGFGRPTGGSSGGGSGSSGGSDDEGLEAQEVPVSHEQLRRSNPQASGTGTRKGALPIVVNISGVVLNGGASQEEFGNYVRKALDRQDRGGRRPRN